VVCFGAIVPTKVNAAAAVESAVCDISIVKTVACCVGTCAVVEDPSELSTSVALIEVGQYFLPMLYVVGTVLTAVHFPE
jgi:hypothetical protein